MLNKCVVFCNLGSSTYSKILVFRIFQKKKKKSKVQNYCTAAQLPDLILDFVFLTTTYGDISVRYDCTCKLIRKTNLIGQFEDQNIMINLIQRLGKISAEDN